MVSPSKSVAFAPMLEPISRDAWSDRWARRRTVSASRSTLSSFVSAIGRTLLLPAEAAIVERAARGG
jgi:hypothetical protein